MNKKTALIASGAAGVILAVSACGTSTYDYEVSGLVQGQQIDYDCPGGDIAMDAVAFVSGGNKGGSKSGKKKSSGVTKNEDSDQTVDSPQKVEKAAGSVASKTPSVKPSKTPSSGTGTSAKSATPTPSPSAKNKGVTMKNKPEKPEKLKSKKLPKLKYKSKPKGCETEYEIFVIANDGYLYEQDVRKVDYDNCEAAKIPAGQKGKLFPLCTKG